jgi:hypothetical protein
MKHDEDYILDLCDEVLEMKSLRQHRFFFLRDESGHRLPVDAFYPRLKLVIEYREHPQRAAPLDHRAAVSNAARDTQRALHDERRRAELPRHGIQLIELSFDEFPHDPRNRLLRSRHKDLVIIRARLSRVMQGPKARVARRTG